MAEVRTLRTQQRPRTDLSRRRGRSATSRQPIAETDPLKLPDLKLGDGLRFVCRGWTCDRRGGRWDRVMPKIKQQQQQQQREEEKAKLTTLGVCLPPGITVPAAATVPDNGRRDLVCSPPPLLSWRYEHLIEFPFIFICRGLGSFRKLAIRRIQRTDGKKPINGNVWEEVGRSRSSLQILGS